MAESIPDIYCDQLQLALSPYGLALTFALSQTNPPAGGPATPTSQAIVRMSLEHAKVMAMIIRKQLKQYELEHLGDPINIPSKVLADLKLQKEDW